MKNCLLQIWFQDDVTTRAILLFDHRGHVTWLSLPDNVFIVTHKLQHFSATPPSRSTIHSADGHTIGSNSNTRLNDCYYVTFVERVYIFSTKILIY